jgi:hypothetical protein
MNSRTLRDAWEAFEASNPKDHSLYQSALLRFVVPGLGGPKPSGARLTTKEANAALRTLATIPLSSDIEERLRAAQRKTFELLETTKQRQRQLRYYLNKFIDWCLENDFFPTNLPEENLEYSFYPEKINRIKTTNRGKTHKFIFSFDVDDYVAESLQAEEIQQHLQRINQEFISFREYLKTKGNRDSTVERHEKDLKLFLGWFYREKGISLTEISLGKLVPFIQLDYQLNEFESESEEITLYTQVIAKAKAQKNIKDEAKRLVNLMKEFFAWLNNPPSIRTKQMYIDALITYSKYIYRDETDKTMASNFEDIPLINSLKIFHKEVNNNKRSNSNLNNKYLPWSDVLGVVNKVQYEANLTTVKNSGYRSKRTLSAQAKSLQDFVLLGFFVLIPPSRQRVIRELELGRTLKYGIFSDGNFTPFDEKMANPSEAKYYIHLQPEDYKTGDIYGEWIGEFPNTEFPDGSRFYDYLNRWLRNDQDENGDWHGMREVIAAPGEKTVFVGELRGKSYSARHMCAKIKILFNRWTGVPISPQDLRHLYRTYIDDPATGATEEEKKSAAFWMRHSTQMANKVYSHLNCEQKLQMGAQMSKRLNQQLLNGRK